MNNIKHPYYDYSLADALSLATTLKRDRLLKEEKRTESRDMVSYSAANLTEAIQVMKEEYASVTFNWITGRVALQVLRAAAGERDVFTF